MTTPYAESIIIAASNSLPEEQIKQIFATSDFPEVKVFVNGHEIPFMDVLEESLIAFTKGAQAEANANATEFLERAGFYPPNSQIH